MAYSLCAKEGSLKACIQVLDYGLSRQTGSGNYYQLVIQNRFHLERRPVVTRNNGRLRVRNQECDGAPGDVIRKLHSHMDRSNGNQLVYRSAPSAFVHQINQMQNEMSR